MLEFMSNETFQIIVMVALIFISIEIYYFYRYIFKSSEAPLQDKNNASISTDKIYEIVDDIDYRLDRINTKINELMNVIMNGMIVSEENNESDKTVDDNKKETALNEDDDILFDKNEMLSTEPENNIENKMFEAIKSHVSELNYDGLDISDLPKTEDLQDPRDLHDLQSGGTSINEEIDENIKILEPTSDETQKNINVVKRILN